MRAASLSPDAAGSSRESIQVVHRAAARSGGMHRSIAPFIKTSAHGPNADVGALGVGHADLLRVHRYHRLLVAIHHGWFNRNRIAHG